MTKWLDSCEFKQQQYHQFVLEFNSSPSLQIVDESVGVPKFHSDHIHILYQHIKLDRFFQIIKASEVPGLLRMNSSLNDAALPALSFAFVCTLSPL